MHVLFRVAGSATRFISETTERFVLCESNPCSAGFYVARGSCKQAVTETLTHILIADAPSLKSGRGGKGTISDRKLHNNRPYLCILSAITEIKERKNLETEF